MTITNLMMHVLSLPNYIVCCRLFADTVDGAMASAVLYSIIETAKANGLEPYWYLRFLLEKAPDLKSKDDFRSLIPQNVDRQLIMNMQQSHVNAGVKPT